MNKSAERKNHRTRARWVSLHTNSSGNKLSYYTVERYLKLWSFILYVGNKDRKYEAKHRFTNGNVHPFNTDETRARGNNLFHQDDHAKTYGEARQSSM